jgi:hypothetical protein
MARKTHSRRAKTTPTTKMKELGPTAMPELCMAAGWFIGHKRTSVFFFLIGRKQEQVLGWCKKKKKKKRFRTLGCSNVTTSSIQYTA